MNHREEMFKLGLYMISMEKKCIPRLQKLVTKKLLVLEQIVLFYLTLNVKAFPGFVFSGAWSSEDKPVHSLETFT